MHALTGQQVRRSFINRSQGEAKGLALPKDFAELDRAGLELLGCADRVRTGIPPWLLERDPAEVVAERAVELRHRVLGFPRSVRG